MTISGGKITIFCLFERKMHPCPRRFPHCSPQISNVPAVSVTWIGIKIYTTKIPTTECKYPCLRRSASILGRRSPTSGDQPMTHPAPVSGPKLITTRQLGYFPYHPNNNKTITSKRKLLQSDDQTKPRRNEMR